MKLSRISLEPFVSGGFRRLDLDGGNGFRTPNRILDVDKLKEEWSLGAGSRLNINHKTLIDQIQGGVFPALFYLKNLEEMIILRCNCVKFYRGNRIRG